MMRKTTLGKPQHFVCQCCVYFHLVWVVQNGLDSFNEIGQVIWPSRRRKMPGAGKEGFCCDEMGIGCDEKCVNPIHVKCRQQVQIVHNMQKNDQNPNFLNQVWIQHVKCIQMSANKFVILQWF